MRKILSFVVLPAAVAAAALVFFLAPRASAGSPSDITGTYSGKLAFKFHPLTEVGTPDRGAVPADATVTMSPPNLIIHVAVHADGGDVFYDLTGTYGLGRFWAYGSGPSAPTTVTGRATGAPGKVRLTFSGVGLGPDSITEVKFVLKQRPASE